MWQYLTHTQSPPTPSVLHVGSGPPDPKGAIYVSQRALLRALTRVRSGMSSYRRILGERHMIPEINPITVIFGLQGYGAFGL
eukprot:407298-Pyramimonas_sp.AAC.1